MYFFKIIKNKELYKLRKYRIYKSLFLDYVKDPFKLFYVWKIHKKGFTVGMWNICKINNKNYKKYLSSKQYNKIHPINDYYSKLIDDKLNIKYIFYGTFLSSVMPNYYYLIDEKGIIHPMMDNENIELDSLEDIFSLLKKEKILALKLTTGSLGKGFYKLEWIEDKIKVNSTFVTKEGFFNIIKSCKNYVITEYLLPHKDLARLWPYTPNTIRYLVGRVGKDWRFIKGTIRIGTKESGEVENFSRGGILSYVNENGEFSDGYIKDKSKNKYPKYEVIYKHPDTQIELKGKIPHWSKLQETVCSIVKLLPMTKYLGFDFVITSKDEVKLLEINSLSSLDALQFDVPMWENENGKWFFSEYVQKN